MKLAIASLLLAGCLDEQNVGNSKLNAQPLFGSPRWAISIGGGGDDVTHSIGLDPDGNVIASGEFDGTVDFGGSVHSAPNGDGGWISKRAAADGHEIWTRTFGGATSLAGVTASATTIDGSVIATGIFDGDLDLGTTVLHGPALHASIDTFVVKYSADGALVWSQTFGAASVAQPTSLAVATDGHVAIGGSYQGTIAFPNGTFTAEGNDAFIVMLDGEGNKQWGASSRNLGNAASPNVDAVAMTAEGDVVVDGNLSGMITFAGATLQTSASLGQFVARFTLAGELLWSGVLASPGHYLEPGPVAIAPDGTAIVTSIQRLPDDSDGNGLPRIDRLDAAGQTTWTRTASGGSVALDAVTVLHDGTVVTGGWSAGFSFDLGTGTLDACWYLAAHDPSGALSDVATYGAAPSCSATIPWAFANAPGTLAMGGVLGASEDLGTGALRYAGDADALIVVYDTP